MRVVDNEDDLLTNSPSGTFADQKHSDEDDKTASDLSTIQDTSANIDRIQMLEKTKEDLTSQIQKRDLEIASQKRLVNTLQDSVKHLNNELEALSNERSQIEKQNQQKIKSISVRAKKQLQYQQARCESLEAIVNDLKKRLETQEKKYESTKKTEESERKNTMEKLQLFQSIVETHEKSMDKLREENLSLQKAFDEVVNGTTKKAWGEDATDDEITNARDADRKTGTISPVEWARNADEMKAGKNGETFVLPSRSLYKSL